MKVKYQVEIVDSQGHLMVFPWLKGHTGGAADTKRLAGYVHSLNESFQAGGCNAHVSQAAGTVLTVKRARVIDQENGDLLAKFGF
jgi:hypothetical protein